MFGKGRRYREPQNRSLIRFVVIVNGLYWRYGAMGSRWTNRFTDAELFDDLESAAKIAKATNGWVYSFNRLTGRIIPVQA